MTAPRGTPSTTPPEERGATDVAAHVVHRIAVKAAEEVPRVREVRPPGAMPWTRHSWAAVDGNLASVRLEMTLDYPAPIRVVADAVRRHVTERVEALTGLTVRQVDIDVAGLVPAPREAPPGPSETEAGTGAGAVDHAGTGDRAGPDTGSDAGSGAGSGDVNRTEEIARVQAGGRGGAGGRTAGTAPPVENHGDPTITRVQGGARGTGPERP
jgi:uncharacterized alkaline shock family protein YloU